MLTQRSCDGKIKMKMTLLSLVLFGAIVGFSQVSHARMPPTLVHGNPAIVDEGSSFNTVKPWYESLPKLNERSLYHMGVKVINSLRGVVGYDGDSLHVATEKVSMAKAD